MISKEDFNKIWKDSTREAILHQYYYDYMDLRKVYSIIKEVREYLPKVRVSTSYELDEKIDNLLEILDKAGEE